MPCENVAPRTIEVSAGAAEQATRSQHLISVFETAQEQFRDAGAMQAVVTIENEIRKERRRMRAICREDDGVLLALARQRDEEYAREWKRLRLVEDANARTTTAATLKAAVAAANKELHAAKAAIAAAENILETKHAMKTFSLDDLGHGKKNGGGGAGRKRRFDVLDRMARLGHGLSAAQKNDFNWWKDNWDAKLLEEHGGEWPRIFAEWMQKLLQDVDGGAGNAFSIFVHSETRRTLHDKLALQVP